MRIVRHLERSRPELRSAVVTLGNFDGVHVGHREILDRVVAEAAGRGGDSVVVTFFPHPAAVLAPERAPTAICSLRERLALIAERGVSTIVVQRFTRAFASLTPEEFIDRYLVGALGAVKVIIGHSVSFGRGRTGNAKVLVEAGAQRGFAVEVVGPVRVGNRAVSSTEVRSALAAGDVLLGAELLGRHYAVEGAVVAGDRRGKGLGFPTANVRPRVPPLVPDGVYAVRVEWQGSSIAGVANIGRNPTFGAGRDRTVEAHLFEFDGDLYGRRIRVGLVERIRGEQRFDSPQALVAQIRNDVERARDILASR